MNNLYPIMPEIPGMYKVPCDGTTIYKMFERIIRIEVSEEDKNFCVEVYDADNRIAMFYGENAISFIGRYYDYQSELHGDEYYDGEYVAKGLKDAVKHLLALS